jgi:hypothetical protein
VEEGEDLGLSRGEMLVEEAGVDSVVAIRRRTASEGRAVVLMFASMAKTTAGRKAVQRSVKAKIPKICWDAGAVVGTEEVLPVFLLNCDLAGAL